MDLIYTVSRKSGFKGHHYDECKHFSNHCKHLIRVSSSNIVAWVTQYDLNDATNTLTGSQVYISDFNMPWNYYKVTSNKGIITTLEWDLHGDYLLIGDDSGTVSIWSYKEHVFNDWICIGSSDFHGEYIIAGTFFHSGRKISLINEKRESFLYYEKFKLDRFFPTVRAKGGTPIDGCFVITSTGMIAALLIREEVETQSLTTVVDIIASTRYRIAVVDICYRNNGHLVVAASSGCQNMPIQCYDIAIQYINEKVTHINSQHLPGFFLDGVINSNNTHLRVSGLKFVIREAADLLIVVISTKSGGSVIQVWQLVDGPYYFNNLVGENSYLEEFKTISWRCQTSVTFDSDVISLTTPKLLINNCIPPSFHILAAFKDNSIRVLTKTLKEESNYNFNTFWNMEAEVKKINGNSNAVNIADMDITWLGNVFIVLDTLGNFYLFQLHIVPELSSPLTVSYAVSQLEYCLVTGLDWWDLTISMRPTMLEAVCERFTDNFQKQPQAVQQNEYCKFLSIKASLYRMLSNGHSKNIDFVLLMTLYSISTAFKSLLRPSDLSSPDKGPGEKLENVLVDSITDVDTVLVSLEPKEFTVEPSTLQSLQQLIQWVAHLSLNILARVPEHRKTNGYDIVTDVQALNMLRELLVIIRIWGLLRTSCLPTFIRNVDNFDGISTLFRLISRLVQCNQQTEIDESLIDDCCLLQNQVLIPMLNSVPREVCDVASPAFYFQSLPIQFSFGLEPESFVYELETVNLDGGLQTTQNSDIIRHVYLGKYPSVMKQCNRCEGKTQVVSNAKTAAIRSWENRWVKTCVCGGKWRYVHSRPPVYSRKPWINISRSQFNK